MVRATPKLTFSIQWCVTCVPRALEDAWPVLRSSSRPSTKSSRHSLKCVILSPFIFAELSLSGDRHLLTLTWLIKIGILLNFKPYPIFHYIPAVLPHSCHCITLLNPESTQDWASISSVQSERCIDYIPIVFPLNLLPFSSCSPFFKIFYFLFCFHMCMLL